MHLFFAAATCCLAAAFPVARAAGTLAPSPPMGWNSWDAYGLTIGESDFKANAAVLATFKQLGWTYAVIDEGWYMQNPSAEKLEERSYQLDAHGLLVPAVNRFPSAQGSAGLRPLADWVHARGLKLGIHVVRGIPKAAVRADLPIAGSHFRTSDAADPSDLCPWDEGNYGVRDDPAGQAYYDSMLKLYARWQIDFIKVDCIADHPYKFSEIRQIAHAIQHSGRRMVLSLSPGPTDLSHAAEVARYAQLWRISNDIWDGWSFTHSKPGDDFPNGIVTAFDNLAKWAPHVRAGNWPDADMLPWGSLAPNPGWGAARTSRLTPDEQRTQFVLWAIARSPLILGTNLIQLDGLTRSLITNHDLIEVNQGAWTSHPVTALPAQMSQVRVWISERKHTGAAADTPAGGGASNQQVIALFNLDDRPATVQAPWAQLGARRQPQLVRDLLQNRALEDTAIAQMTLPPHGTAVYRLN